MNVFYVILFSVVTILSSFTSFAQTLGFNYQAIVKADQTQFFEIYGETVGLNILAESNLSMRFSIIDVSVKPERIEYQEEHYTRTNQFGEVNLTIGAGTPLFGSFTDILWNGKKKLMNVEIDYTATGNTYQFSNSQDLLYLPHPTSGFENSLITINSDSIQEIRLDLEQYAMDRKSFDLVLSDSIDFLRDEIDIQKEKMNSVETVLPKIEINSQNIRENGERIQRLSDILVNPITGPKGDTGEQGIQGETGPAGPAGANGNQGSQGVQGDKGDKGDAGAQGVKGDKGDVGVQGVQGETGPAGLAGANGAQGPQGIQGDTGPQGPQGVKGDKGDKGDTGTQGAKGDTGTKGDSAYEVWESQEGNGNKTEAEFLALFTDLESGKVFVGNDSNKKAAVNLTGDASLSSTGVLTISDNAVNTAKIKDDHVTAAKLASDVAGTGLTQNTDGSLKVDLSTMTQGLLLPRITGQERDVISDPVAGLLVWCLNCGYYGEIQVYNGAKWTNMVGDDTTPVLPTMDASGYLVFDEPSVYSTSDENLLKAVFNGDNVNDQGYRLPNSYGYYIFNVTNDRIILDMGGNHEVSAFRYINSYLESVETGPTSLAIKHAKVYGVEESKIGSVNIENPIYNELPLSSSDYTIMFDDEFVKPDSATYPFTEENLETNVTARYIIIDAVNNWNGTNLFGLTAFEVKGTLSE